MAYNDERDDINSRGPGDDKLDELEAAYAADMNRKSVREEELQAARDYLGVILEEAEGKSIELEDKKQEANALAARLYRTENEIGELKAQSKRFNRQGKFLTFWMCFSLLELILIAGLVIALYLNINSGKNKQGDTTNVKNVGTSASSDPTPAPDAEEPLTARFSEELPNLIKYVSHESIAPFTVSTEKIDGLEYLVFSHDDIRVCYKNEYYLDEINFRKSVVIERGDSRFTFMRDYDLNADPVELCPILTNIGGVKYLTFVDYEGNIISGVPSGLRFISCSDFRMCECTDLKQKVLNLMTVEALQELSPIEGYPCVYSLTTSKAAYKYAISDNDNTEIQYNEFDIPEIASEFKLDVTDSGINWNTNVKLGNGLYLGALSGSLVIKNDTVLISGAKFGAYVPANQEDPALQGYIIPSERAFDSYLTVGGYNGERFYVAFNDKIDTCEYYWDNLDTSDPNNWIYYDADGNKASYRGIDVSKYQGAINWSKVAAQGVEFAIIRLGFRGMNEGTLELDEYFTRNMKGALDNGIKVGVYFFSQAVNEKEAIEEANYVINLIKDYKVEYPVIFDTERVTTYNARANGLGMEERTQLCKTFCDTVEAAGYKSMIYANTKYMLMGIDLTQLNDYDKWFAVYSSSITFPYDFEMLQYSESGSIDGISGKVDLNISFVDYSAQ